MIRRYSAWVNLGLCVVLGMVLFVVSCGPNDNPSFEASRLPRHKYLVGGGMSINYRARGPSVAYLVEYKTRTILFTKSVAFGEELNWSFHPTDTTFRNKVGRFPKDSEILLYIVPSGEVVDKPE
jgi:hypothetical protein